jgi:transposase
VKHAKIFSCRVSCARCRAVALVRAGKPVTTTAAELGISQSCLHNWIRQDQVNRGELRGVTTSESAELRRARKRIRQLELEVEILIKASQFLAEDKSHPEGFTR